MKKLKLKKEVSDFLGAMFFYLVILLSVIVLNARMEYLNEQNKRTDIETAQCIDK